MIDVDSLRAKTDLVELVSRYVQLKQDGKEYTGLCPFHDEKTASFYVVPAKHFYHCFGCGAHGDCIDFIEEMHSVDFQEAVKILGGKPSDTPVPAKRTPTPAAEPEWKPILPIPLDAGPLLEDDRSARLYNPKRAGTPKEWTTLTPDLVDAYNDSQGRTLGYVLRCEFSDGGKFTPQVTYCQNAAGEKRWALVAMPDPRPLLGLDALAKRPADAVLVVEGEKTRRAAERLLASYVVLTWAGGGNGVKHADWRPLYGRDVLIWPDADEPGMAAALEIGKALGGSCKRLRVLEPMAGPDPQTDGWDAADAESGGWYRGHVVAWAKTHVRDISEIMVKPEPPTTPPQPTSAPTPSTDTPTKQPPLSEPPANAKPPRKARSKPQLATVNGAPVPAPTPDTDAAPESLPASVLILWERLKLDLNGRAFPHINLDNCVRCLLNHEETKGHVWFDEFHRKFYTDWRGDKREWSDGDDLLLAIWYQRELGLIKVSAELAHSAMQVAAAQQARNEPLDWMETLVWDRQPRVELFLHNYFGATDNKYTRAASKNFWISCVARVFDPGCQVDNMLVLEGRQGAFKTSALRIIGGKWYAAAHETVMKTDFFMALQGKLIVEISEMDSFGRAETARVKHTISCRTDRFRAPYARSAEDHPRRSIFVGTTNQDAYLRDTTGARRFWPIACKDINRDALTEDREQLYAEALALYRAGTSWWEIPLEDAEAEQEARRQTDIWEDAIEHWLNGRIDGGQEVTLQEIIENVLEIPIGKAERKIELRVGECLRALGYFSTNRVVTIGETGKKQKKVWRRRAKLPPALDDGMP